MTTKAALLAWIATEREVHASSKYGEDKDARLGLVADMESHPHIDGEWDVFIGNYLRRAQLFGLDTPQGRQALGKTVVTLMHCLETAVDVFGPMPAPGVPSGVIEAAS